MRRRLTLLVAATMCLVLAAFLAPLALLPRSAARDRAVVAATTQVQGLISATGTADRAALSLAAQQVAAGSARPVTVFLGDGTTLGSPAERTPAVRLATRGRSLSVQHEEGREIVVAVLGRPEGTAVVRTFVPTGELTRGVTRSWLVLAGLGAALLLLGLLVADRLARNLIAPIAELSAVSHRLRTPLTSLRLEAESLADPAEAARVAEAVDGVERAVTAVIRQARAKAAGAVRGECDAAAVTRERVGFWTALADDTGRAVTADLAAGPLPVSVSADDLAAALDALLGNVFAHTPDGTPFTVRISSRPAGSVTITSGETVPASSAPSIAPSAKEGAVSRERAVEIALARTGGGSLDQVENEMEHGRAAWKVRIVKDGIRYSSYIDKATGEIFRFRDDGRD